jgi:hypothetical protein
MGVVLEMFTGRVPLDDNDTSRLVRGDHQGGALGRRSG